jgi:hypothetical protein
LIPNSGGRDSGMRFKKLSNLHHTVIPKSWNKKRLEAVNLCKKTNREPMPHVLFVERKK